MSAFQGNAFQNNAFQTGGASSQSRVVIATGGAVFQGAGLTLRTIIREAAGGCVLVPVASVTTGNGTQSRVVISAGAFVLSGTVPAIRSTQYVQLGGLTFSGTGNTVLFPDPTPRPARAYKRGRRPRFRIL